VSVVVPGERAEEATAAMLELFPEGFVEERRADSVELSAFTDPAGVDSLRDLFGRVETEPVAPGWEDEWKRFHRPVQVGSLWIGPPWENAPEGVKPVVIDPGRAFGTGAHPTTRLCVELLLELEPGSIVDVGCGSGVLAIAAAKLGFAPVVAADADEAAVEAATRNVAANGVAVDVRLLDAETGKLPAAEIAVANIDLATLGRISAPSAWGALVTSGYYEADRPSFPGFAHLARKTDAGWAADLFGRQ
jgi:ribosomal protein L11 methyltransferase